MWAPPSLSVLAICSEALVRLAGTWRDPYTAEGGIGRTTASQTFHFLGMASLETVQNLSVTKNKRRSLHSHLAGQEQSEHGGARFPPPPGRSPHCWAPLGKVASTQPHPQSRCLPSHLTRHRGLIVPSLLCAGRPPQPPLEIRHCPGATTKDVHEACVQGSVQT